MSLTEFLKFMVTGVEEVLGENKDYKKGGSERTYRERNMCN
jgi:hypothetical protein